MRNLAARIEDIEYKAEEIESLMLALEEGIFGKNWSLDSFQMGYSHVWDMVANLVKELGMLKNEIRKKKGEAAGEELETKINVFCDRSDS